MTIANIAHLVNMLTYRREDWMFLGHVDNKLNKTMIIIVKAKMYDRYDHLQNKAGHGPSHPH